MNEPGTGALIVQSDLSLLLDVHAPGSDAAREAIGGFAMLEKSPEHLHTYRITPLSLWNAAAAGLTPDLVMSTLAAYTRYELPKDIPFIVRDQMGRFGALSLHDDPADPRRLILRCLDKEMERRLGSDRTLGKWISTATDGFSLKLVDRGTVKIELQKRGWPVKDEASLSDGETLPLALEFDKPGNHWTLRPYQSEAVNAFIGGGRPGNGYGVIVLPCGSGKTIVGMAAMAALQQTTLIITTNIAAVHQWRDELLARTNIDPALVGEYSGARKEIKPITIATYQILTWRPDKVSDFPHFELLRKVRWGLVICDEVHLIPAPVFRVVAELQAMRRMGLTATLVREDGREEDVFCLIGPKRYDVPWKELERKGFIAEAWCKELRIPMDDDTRLKHAVADQRARIRIAAENPIKEEVVSFLAEHHAGEGILVIGQYIDQLKRMARLLQAPLITGATPEAEREALYASFRAGETRLLVVSKVANFAIDLPDASVAIQISGSYGSRQEEAQRLGRILRPKERNSFFYSLVTRYSAEEEFADNRRRFLIEQGYRYAIEAWER